MPGRRPQLEQHKTMSMKINCEKISIQLVNIQTSWTSLSSCLETERQNPYFRVLFTTKTRKYKSITYLFGLSSGVAEPPKFFVNTGRLVLKKSVFLRGRVR